MNAFSASVGVPVWSSPFGVRVLSTLVSLCTDAFVFLWNPTWSWRVTLFRCISGVDLLMFGSGFLRLGWGETSTHSSPLTTPLSGFAVRHWWPRAGSWEVLGPSVQEFMWFWGLWSSLKTWKDSLVSPLGLGFLWEVFINDFGFFIKYQTRQIFLLLLPALVNCISENLSIQIYKFIHNPFTFSVICADSGIMSPFLLLVINSLSLLPFSLSALLRNTNFMNLFKEPTSDFVDFLYCVLSPPPPSILSGRFSSIQKGKIVRIVQWMHTYPKPRFYSG